MSATGDRSDGVAVQEREKSPGEKSAGARRVTQDRATVCEECRLVLSYREVLLGRCGNCRAELKTAPD
jgi:hypothetical protein